MKYYYYHFGRLAAKGESEALPLAELQPAPTEGDTLRVVRYDGTRRWYRFDLPTKEWVSLPTLDYTPKRFTAEDVRGFGVPN